MMYRLLCAAAAAAALAGAASAGEPVRFANESYATTCAEYDNVHVTMTAGGVRRFEIAARHPAYAETIGTDLTAPDFTTCSFSSDPAHPFEPKSLTLYRDDRIVVRGHTYSANWRPEKVGLEINGAVTPELHLVQVIRLVEGEEIEILVVYPSDGYWRAKPLPPRNLPDSAYGSSFLVGPVEEDGRPLVRFSRLVFDPARLVFSFDFAAGGRGELAIAAIGHDELRLSVSLEGVASDTLPFAALRSMYVDAESNDVAEAWLLPPGDPVWRRQGIVELEPAEAVAARFGRIVPSDHNTSAPDMIFERFQR